MMILLDVDNLKIKLRIIFSLQITKKSFLMYKYTNYSSHMYFYMRPIIIECDKKKLKSISSAFLVGIKNWKKKEDFALALRCTYRYTEQKIRS